MVDDYIIKHDIRDILTTPTYIQPFHPDPFHQQLEPSQEEELPLSIPVLQRQVGHIVESISNTYP